MISQNSNMALVLFRVVTDWQQNDDDNDINEDVRINKNILNVSWFTRNAKNPVPTTDGIYQ